MEVIGFAISVASLANLIDTCMLVVDNFETYKNSNIESQQVRTTFIAHKLLFQRWASSVGIVNGQVIEKHHIGLDDQHTLVTVQDILLTIRDLFTSAESAFSKLFNTTDQPNFQNGAFDGPDGLHLEDKSTKISRKQKITWMMRGKTKLTTQVHAFGYFVRILYDLVPPMPTKAPDAQDVHEVDSEHKILPDYQSVVKERSRMTQPPQGSNESPQTWLDDLQSRLLQMMEVMKVEKRREIDVWLGATTTHDRYEESISARVSGTATWILKRPIFSSWMSPKFPGGAKILWINAPAGYGKTILCGNIVEHLIQDQPVAYFFFSSNIGVKDPSTVFRSWISQILAQDQDAFELAVEQFQKKAYATATQNDTIQLLRSIIQSKGPYTLVVDGLDEYTHEDSTEVSRRQQFLALLKNAVKETETRILVVSRDEPDIRSEMSQPEQLDSAGYCLSEYKLSPDDVQSDVSLFSKTVVSQKLPNKSDALKERVASQMAEKSGGMFLWVKMQGASLRAGRNEKQIQKAIEAAPSGLDSLYDRNWTTILKLEDGDRSRAMSILRWALFAVRPLTVAEITEALLVDEEFPVDDLPDVIDQDYVNSELLGLCASLVELRKPDVNQELSSSTIHLVHFSIKEYLLVKFTSSLPTASEQLYNEEYQKNELVKVCLCYLNCHQTWPNSFPLQDKLPTQAFLDYACRSWSSQISKTGQNYSQVLDLLKKLFHPSKGQWKPWSRAFEDQEGNSSKDPGGPLYYASLLGLNETVDYLQDEFGVDTNATGGSFGCPLQAACSKGHISLVKDLLKRKADPNWTQKDHSTALETAINLGNAQMVELLLENGAKPDTKSGNDSPLYTAAKLGHGEIVHLLIEKGADLTAQNEKNLTPLYISSSNGHLDVVKVLLEKGGKDIISLGSIKPLSAASREGHLHVIKLLVEIGGDVNERDEDEEFPLRWAAIHGHLDVVKLLLEKGADIAAKSAKALTALHAATFNGHLEVVRLLLDNGAVSSPSSLEFSALHMACVKNNVEMVKLVLNDSNINDLTVNDDTPINVAASYGHFEVIQFLLENGADFSIPDDEGMPPISIAARAGSVKVVDLLLSKGAELENRNKQGETPLLLAASRGHTEMVRFLGEKGANLDVQTNDGRTPLFEAASKAANKVVHLLLELGANPSISTNEGRTPLMAAVDSRDIDSVKHLLNSDTDVTLESLPESAKRTLLTDVIKENAIDLVRLLVEKLQDLNSIDRNDTPLTCACEHGRLEVATLLLDKGVELDLPDGQGASPLHLATKMGHVSVAELLIKKGANVNLQHNGGRTPLYLAAALNRVELGRLLLENGANPELFTDLAWTPLNIACEEGHIDMVRLLLEQKGIDLEGPNTGAWTPFVNAADRGFLEIVQLLIEKGASLNSASQKGWQAIHAAATKGHLEVVKYLVDQDPKVLEVYSNDGSTPFYTACMNNQPEIIQLLLDLGDNIDRSAPSGWNGLLIAANSGFVNIIKFLIDRGANIEARTDLGATPLYLAASKSHPDAVRCLLEYGADVKITENNGWTPVNVAADRGNLEIVKMLLDHGADTTVISSNKWTPINSAADNGHDQVVKLLLEHDDSQLNVGNYIGYPPLHSAACKGATETMKLLLDAGADMNIPDKDGWLPIISAAFFGHLEAVKLLVENGSDVNLRNKYERSPLDYAASKGHTEVVSFLIQSGADPNIKGYSGWTPVNSAANAGHLDATKILVEKKADLNISTNQGWTPVHSAVHAGHLEVVKLLIDQGADIKIPNKNGWVPLHTAANRGHFEIAKILIDKGAEINKPNADGWTPLNFAAHSGSIELVTLLMEKDALPNIQNNWGWSPFHIALENDKNEVARLLMGYPSVDINVTSVEKWTPLHTAAEHGQLDIIKYLIEKGAHVNAIGKSNWTPFHLALEKDQLEAAQLLLEYDNIDTTTPTVNMWTPLHTAAEHSQLDMMKLLIERGADVNAMTSRSWTPFHIALEKKKFEAARFLMENKDVDPTIASSFEWTPLHTAAEYSELDMFKALMERGIDIHAHSKSGRTPMHVAADYGNLEVVNFLVDKVEIDLIVKNTWTPLYYALNNGHFEVVECLLKHGADWDKSARPFETPISPAVRGGNIKLIQRAQETVGDRLDLHGRNPLHLAARFGKMEAFNFFLDKKYDINAKDEIGWSVLHHAVSGASLEMIKRVLELVDLKTISSPNWSLLHLASRKGDEEVINEIKKLDTTADEPKEVSTDDPARSWTPADIAWYHHNDQLVKDEKSDETKAQTDKAKEAGQDDQSSTHSLERLRGDKHGNYTCDGCYHVIYGHRHQCKECSNFDYCFMCYEFMNKVHSDHSFERVELEK